MQKSLSVTSSQTLRSADGLDLLVAKTTTALAKHLGVRCCWSLYLEWTSSLTKRWINDWFLSIGLSLCKGVSFPKGFCAESTSE